MGNNDHADVHYWVDEHLALVAPPPDWHPDSVRGRALLQRRDARRWSAPARWKLAATVAVLVVVTAFVSPFSRALAQQLWQRFTVHRVDVVRSDVARDKGRGLDALRRALPTRVRDLDEAAERVGFVPRLPPAGTVSGTPDLSTAAPLSITTLVHVGEVERAVQSSDPDTTRPVPAEWEGTTLTMSLGPTVAAEWPDVTLVQGYLPSIAAAPPTDLTPLQPAILHGPLSAFYLSARLIYKAGRTSPGAPVAADGGMRDDRQVLSAASLLFGIRQDSHVGVREVQLQEGAATLVEDFGENGAVDRATLLWSATDRVYMLIGDATSRQRLVPIADAINAVRP